MYPANLKNLVASVRRLYVAAAYLPARERPLVGNIKRILDRLNLLALVHEYPTIAVGGLQGVGKTALIRAMYQLELDVLPESGGRDERTPIRIVEHPYHQMEAFALRTDDNGHIASRAIPVPDLRDQSREAADAFAFELRVPSRYFDISERDSSVRRAWLLLPGSEDIEQEWDRRVAVAMKAADACLFVTSPTRMADGRHKQFLVRMKEQFGAQPLAVAITGADQSEDRNQQVAETVRQLLDVSPQLIVATDASPGGDRTWIEPLCKAVDASLSVRLPVSARLDELQSLLTDDLGDAVERLAHYLAADAATDRSQELSEISPVLSAFDGEVKALRPSFKRALRDAIQQHRASQTRAWQERVANQGVIEGARGLFGGTLKQRLRFQDELRGLWSESAISSARRSAILTAEMHRYQVVAKVGAKGSTALFPSSEGDASAASVQSSRSLMSVSAVMSYLDDKDMADLRYLAGSRDVQPTVHLSKTVQYLPLFALEAARLRFEADVGRGSSLQEAPAPLTANDVLMQLQQASVLQEGFLKAIGTLLAIDFAADARLDLPARLATALGLGQAAAAGSATAAAGGAAMGGASAAAVGSALITAAVGVAVVAGITYREIVRQEFKLAEWGSHTLQAWAEDAEAAAIEKFDEGMQLIRERLASVLASSHGLERRLGERQILAAAKARCDEDVKEVHREIHRRRSGMV